jgi:acyl-CoA thioesterase
MSDENASELARRVAKALMCAEGTAASWNLVLEEALEGRSRVRMTVRPDMLNGHRTAHGGMIFALADSAFAYACNSRNEASVAQQASIIFLAPASEGDVLVAEAREDSRAGRSGSYSVSVFTEEGRPIAQFLGLSRTIGGPVLVNQE